MTSAKFLFFLVSVLLLATSALSTVPSGGSSGSSGSSIIGCYTDDPYKPTAVMTWGINAIRAAPGVSSLAGWTWVDRITGDSLESSRQEALQWYKERYGFDNTVLSYNHTSGFSVLPQGTMLPTFLSAQGDYHLWAESTNNVVSQTCPSMSVIEWVLFVNTNMAGVKYNGTYGQWYETSGRSSFIQAGDVVSIGRYVVNGSRRSDDILVMPFKTWYPVRLDPEHTYRVDNVIQHPTLGTGHGQSNYRYYPTAANPNVQSVQIRNTIIFPFLEPPPMSPQTWA